MSSDGSSMKESQMSEPNENNEEGNEQLSDVLMTNEESTPMDE